MPNTPVVVQNGVTIHAAGSNIEEEDRLFLTKMLSSVGIGMEMQEHYMDIMTALSGGGPSFVSTHVLYCSDIVATWIATSDRVRYGAHGLLRCMFRSEFCVFCDYIFCEEEIVMA